MHQDVISEKTCGEGVPLWAAQTDTSAKYSFPWPLEKPFNVGSDAVPTRQDCDKHDWPKYHGALATGKVFSVTRDRGRETIGALKGEEDSDSSSCDFFLKFRISTATRMDSQIHLLITGVCSQRNSNHSPMLLATS